jgi:hypothetical protein
MPGQTPEHFLERQVAFPSRPDGSSRFSESHKHFDVSALSIVGHYIPANRLIKQQTANSRWEAVVITGFTRQRQQVRIAEEPFDAAPSRKRWVKNNWHEHRFIEYITGQPLQAVQLGEHRIGDQGRFRPAARDDPIILLTIQPAILWLIQAGDRPVARRNERWMERIWVKGDQTR